MVDPSRYVANRAGMPTDIHMQRPSVEFTGLGNDLIYFAWNSRFFRSDFVQVRMSCEKAVNDVNGIDENGERTDGACISVADLETEWGLKYVDDAAYRFGWAPDENYPFPCFVYEICDEGTNLYDMWGERVYVISIPEQASPYECFMEI